MEIILASTSPYRRQLLERLGVKFRCLPPLVGEASRPGESAAELALRLSIEKAEAIARLHPQALVIGSDQVAEVAGGFLGKPGNYENALGQLRRCAGKEVLFHTGLAVICQQRAVKRFHVEPYSVQFRSLSEAQLANYLRSEEPYDSAGSFKVEGLGIALFKSLQGKDPTALEGLPLIALTAMLESVGVRIL